MKRYMIMVAILVATAMMTAAMQQPETMARQSDGTYVVNTTALCKAKGYKGKTPVEVYIKDNKVVKVVALRNQETPKYFAMVKKTLLPKYAGMKASKVGKAQVDGVTGATFSSEAVKENVRAAVEYYRKHKK